MSCRKQNDPIGDAGSGVSDFQTWVGRIICFRKFLTTSSLFQFRAHAYLTRCSVCTEKTFQNMSTCTTLRLSGRWWLRLGNSIECMEPASTRASVSVGVVAIWHKAKLESADSSLERSFELAFQNRVFWELHLNIWHKTLYVALLLAYSWTTEL